jgi:hypothetical protein
MAISPKISILSELTESCTRNGKPYDERLSRTVWRAAVWREPTRLTLLFFMVKNLNMLNIKSHSSLLTDIISNNDENNIVNGNGNNNNRDDDKEIKDLSKSKHKYVKILVDDPFNNRNIILKVTKKQKGVYI